MEDLSIDYLHEMLRIDIFIKDDDAIELAELIASTVDTHQEGDGVIFVSDIIYAMNIDSGGTGTGAFQVLRDKDL